MIQSSQHEKDQFDDKKDAEGFKMNKLIIRANNLLLIIYH